MNELMCALFGYSIGCINPAYIISKIHGFDIRREGSGNAGASNAVITMGKAAGVFSALFDILKAYLAVVLAARIFKKAMYARVISGTACILGHIFPVLMRFHGGKGLACLGGVVLSFRGRYFLTLLFLETVLVLIVDYICVVPITASVIFPVSYFLITKDAPGTLIYLIATVAILGKHMENIQRIRHGREMRFSYLWNKDEEINRLRKNYSSDDVS